MTQLDLTRRPVLIWDGDCAFCARCAAFQARHRLGAGVDVVPWQDVDPPPWLTVGLTRRPAGRPCSGSTSTWARCAGARVRPAWPR
jgi:hypothetical protein